MTTVSHSGDVGDILYACCAMSVLAAHRGQPLDLVIYSAPGVVRSAATPQSVASLAPLLLQQPYIGGVRYADQPEGERLDQWREWWPRVEGYGISLCAAHLMQFRIDPRVAFNPWLTVPEPKAVAPVVIHRSPRYHNHRFQWRAILEKYGDGVVMVGMPDEHAAFEQKFGPVRYHPTGDFLELAQVIAGAKLFVGNQSSPYAIAEGLKMSTIQETWVGDDQQMGYANCVFPRGNAVYVTNGAMMLPAGT